MVVGTLPLRENEGKSRSTFYTPARVAAARNNVMKYDWAAKLCDAATAKAEAYLTLGFDFFWQVVPPQSLPRSTTVNRGFGSVLQGKAIDQFGKYPYVADPLTKPWKLQDPTDGHWYPTNDFAAFYQSGLNAHRIFDPLLADRSLLYHVNHPDPDDPLHQWGVDDGTGWVSEDGEIFTFIACYNHWYLWYGGETALTQKALNAFREAYLYTGHLQYARIGIILLDRIADIYPDLDISQYDPEIYTNSHGGSGKGKAIGSIWETTLVKDYLYAYDAFLPAMDDKATIDYLHAKALQFNLHNLKGNAADIKRNIENGIVRQVYPGVRNGQIRGNNGFHQSSLALAAVVIDHLPETKEWMDFNFQAGGSTGGKVTGGNILVTMVNDVDRDGFGDEAAPGYNRLWLQTYQAAADMLDGYDLYPAADLYQHIKFRKMYHSLYPVVLSNRYTAQIGDSGSAGEPSLAILAMKTIVKAFERYGDPIFAQLAYFLNDDQTEGIHSDIFTSDPDQVAGDIAAIIAKDGPLDLKSSNLTGYGFAVLRDGKDNSETLRDIWMYYGRTSGHGHRDALNLGIHFFGLDLSPDLGNPETKTATDAHRYEWINNTISHNTVVVDQAKQRSHWVGAPIHYDDVGSVQLIDVEAPQVYPQTELYRRTTAMIRVDDRHSYVIDFFRIKGGNHHHFSFHGAEGTIGVEGMKLIPQQNGTYAGAEITYAQNTEGPLGASYTGSGFHYLKNVETAIDVQSAFSVDWKIKDSWQVLQPQQADDIHLRLTMLTDVNGVALADGVPAQNVPGNPAHLKYMIAHRQGINLHSLFTSVIEPYQKQRFIQTIAAVGVKKDGILADDGDIEVRALKVELVNGRIDYIVNALDPSVVYIVDDKLQFQGFFGLYSEQDGEPIGTYVNEGTRFGLLGSSDSNTRKACLQGIIIDFTKELMLHNEIIVQITAYTESIDGSLAGRMIYIENDGARNAVYFIQEAAPLGESRYKLAIGDTTLVRCYMDANDFNQGYRYDISQGSSFRIPLSYRKGAS